MNDFFGKEILDRVRMANDLVEVVQWLGVPLKRAGASHKALCPFHKEKTPSFHVNLRTQSFKCFGCGQGGDVFKFLMLREGLDFSAAVRRLAERAGIALPENATPGARGPTRERRERLYDALAKARDWYHLLLMRDRRAETARRYLREREFGGAIAKEYRLGFSPAGGDGLVAWAKTQGIELAALEEAGLALRSRSGLSDRFRGRLMIPISDDFGRVVGFTARLLDPGAKEAKYINSPETPVFHKGRLLFGLDRAKRVLQERRTALLCEGQLDCIRCQSAGLGWAVAPQGTALTEDQARILRRYADEAVLCFDADSAGQEATWRNAGVLLATGLSVKAVTLPAGEDPDSLIRKRGGATMEKLLAAAADVFEHRALALREKLDMRVPRNHQRVVEDFTPLLALVESEPARLRAVANVCEILGIPTEAFLAEYARLRRRTARPSAAPAAEAPLSPEAFRCADYLLRIALTEAPGARMLAAHLRPEWLEGYPLAAVLAHVLSAAKKGEWQEGWSGAPPDLDDEARAMLASVLMQAGPSNRKALVADLQDNLHHLERQHLFRQRDQILSRLKAPSLSPAAQQELQARILDVKKAMQRLAKSPNSG
ncbi:MAG: DNA primase [Verrucomicrobiae bacterium]|nr:DNA primase [Verrucomicrobiae bacterium]